MKKLKTHVRTNSVNIILGGVALLIVVNLLARFNIINLTDMGSNIITSIGALFLLSEVAVMSLIKRTKKKFELGNLVIAGIGLLSLFGVVMSLLNVPIQFLSSIQGITEISLLIAILVEIFRKN